MVEGTRPLQACPHANACFTAGNGSPCAKLVTTPEFLPVLQQTLIQIEDNIETGKEHGWEMYVSNQENQATGLWKVIQELQLPPRNARRAEEVNSE